MEKTDNKPPRIYLRNLHQWVECSQEERDNYYKEIAIFRIRQQDRGACSCPRRRWWYCNMDCLTCRYYRGSGMLSLDAGSEDSDGNEVTLLDQLAENEAPDCDPQAILEDKELLNRLYAHVAELDDKKRVIIEGVLKDMNERDIAKAAGKSQTTINYQHRRAVEILSEKLSDFA